MLQSSLSYEQATSRFALFTSTPDINYRFHLTLRKGDRYEGTLNLSFELQKVTSDFCLDYAGDTIISLKINGTSIENSDSYRKLRFIYPPIEHLKAGKNTIDIKFSNAYAKDGNGLHSFVDIDGIQYIYSTCEPFYANKIYPCFDQPDLKGKFHLTLTIPKEWVGVSNELIDHTEPTANENPDYKVIYFKSPEHAISTYLYAIIAGSYAEIPCEKPYKDIPMSIYCRKSLLQYLQADANDLFTVNMEAMKFYENFFGYPFPFPKNDQIFCPEYNIGAMENPGATTYNDELYVFKEDVVIERKSRRITCMVHELAHMWFGNLVTMKWWNDLWLNESFADLCAHHCLSELCNTGTRPLAYLNIVDGWFMLLRKKIPGYTEDQYQTTHPVSSYIANTEAAETNFDMITYAKGASSLKQLMCLMTPKTFSEGLHVFFKKFEWKNIDLNDFIGVLQDFYKPVNPDYPSTLDVWKEEWLCVPGVNVAEAEWNPEDKSPQAVLKIKQSIAYPGVAKLRHHKMKIAFCDKDFNVYEVKDVVLANKEHTTLTYDGSKNPVAILLNYQDEDFIKIRVDEYTFIKLLENLHRLEVDDLTKAITWLAIWEMCRDSEICSYEFLTYVESNILHEKSDTVLSYMLIFSLSAVDQLTPIPDRPNLARLLFEKCKILLVQATPDQKGRSALLRDFVIKFARDDDTIDHVQELVTWFDGTNIELSKIPLTISYKWAIVTKIYAYKRFDNATKLKYFEKVAQEDKTNALQLNKKRCEAILLTKEERKTHWKQYISNSTGESMKVMIAGMEGFMINLSVYAEEDREMYEDLYFEDLLEVFKTQTKEYAKNLMLTLFPEGDHLQVYSDKVNKLIEKCPEKEAWLLKQLKQFADKLKMRIKAYAAVTELTNNIPNLSEDDFMDALTGGNLKY